MGLFAVPALASNLATGSGGLVYTGSFHQLGVQALGLVTVGVFTFSLSFGALWTLKQLWGIRVEEHVETAGLTSPSTACGAIPSSTSRSPAAMEPSRTRTCSGTDTGTSQPSPWSQNGPHKFPIR